MEAQGGPGRPREAQGSPGRPEPARSLADLLLFSV